jgi:hypothetical protein
MGSWLKPFSVMDKRETISLSLGDGGTILPPTETLHYTDSRYHRLGVMLGVYASGASGGHINPAVTFANCVLRGFPWRKLPVYVLAQTLGAMAGSAIVYGNYKSAINA